MTAVVGRSECLKFTTVTNMSQDLRRRTSREGRWRYPCRKWHLNYIHLWTVNTVSISVIVPSAHCRP